MVNKYFLYFHICPGSSKNKLYKCWTWIKLLLLKIYKTSLYVIFFPISQISWELFPNANTKLLVVIYIAQAPNPYLDHTFWRGIITPINLNTIYYIIGIILPHNKVTFTTFTKYRTDGMLSLQIKRAFQAYQVYKIWSSFACPINSNTEKK